MIICQQTQSCEYKGKKKNVGKAGMNLIDSMACLVIYYRPIILFRGNEQNKKGGGANLRKKGKWNINQWRIGITYFSFNNHYKLCLIGMNLCPEMYAIDEDKVIPT